MSVQGKEVVRVYLEGKNSSSDGQDQASRLVS